MTDLPGPRRSRLLWAAGAGIAVVAGAVAGVVALSQQAHHGDVAAASVGTGEALAAVPSSATAETTTASAVALTVAPSAALTTTPVLTLDVDGDGRQDSATTTFVGRRSARLVVHLATGTTLTSAAYPLFPGDGAGTVAGYDVNGDHRSELLVTEPGGDGVGYELFSLVGSRLVRVPPPKGQLAPYLYIGGGIYYQSTFGCAADRLVIARERPDVKNVDQLPADPPFFVTTTTYALSGGKLSRTASRTVHVGGRAEAAKVLARSGNGCGTHL